MLAGRCQTARPRGGTQVVRLNDKKAIGWRGQKLNAKTILMLQRAERQLGRRLELFQGSFNPGGVQASSHTHDFGGVLDAKDDSPQVVKALREAGFAAWPRKKGGSIKVDHTHAVSVFDTHLHPEAADQRADFKQGGNGLSPFTGDDDPSPRVPLPSEPGLRRQVVRRHDLVFNKTNDSIGYLQDRLGVVPDRFFGSQTRAATVGRLGWDGTKPLGRVKFLRFFPRGVFRRSLRR
jgi:hypothetical protein